MEVRVHVVMPGAAAGLADMREQVDSELPVAGRKRITVAVAAREEVLEVVLAGIVAQGVRGRVEELGCWVKGLVAMGERILAALKLQQQAAAEVQRLLITPVRPECVVVVA